MRSRVTKTTGMIVWSGAGVDPFGPTPTTGLPVPPPLFAEVAETAGLAGAKVSGSASADLAGYVAAAPGLRIFSGNDADPWATMRAGGAGVISGRSSAYPEVYAALRGDPGVQEQLDRIVALGASIGRIKHALHVRGLAGSAAGRMTIDPPEQELAAAIAAEVAGLLDGAAGAAASVTGTA